MAAESRLIDDKYGLSAMAGIASATEHHQQPRAPREGAPELGAGDLPTPTSTTRRPARDGGHVRPMVGLGHRHCDQLLAGRDGWQPLPFLFLSAGAQQGPHQ